MPAPKGNQYAIGNWGGRPPIYDSPEQLWGVVEAYLSHCEENKEPLTITGLTLYLGFSSRETLYLYEKKEEFMDIIKRARLIVEQGYEFKLHKGNPIGPIFALKNMGWKDTQDIKHGAGEGDELSEVTIKVKRK